MGLTILFMLIFIWLYTHESRPLKSRSSYHHGSYEDERFKVGEVERDSFRNDEARYEGESKFENVDIPF